MIKTLLNILHLSTSQKPRSLNYLFKTGKYTINICLKLYWRYLNQSGWSKKRSLFRRFMFSPDVLSSKFLNLIILSEREEIISLRLSYSAWIMTINLNRLPSRVKIVQYLQLYQKIYRQLISLPFDKKNLPSENMHPHHSSNHRLLILYIYMQIYLFTYFLSLLQLI